MGKTHLKYLLMDKRPPHLRTSTQCAEVPVRIEIRTVTETRFQKLKGQWKEIDGEEMLETVAKMILLAEPDTGKFFDEKTPGEFIDESSKKQKQNVLTRIVNWITKRSQEGPRDDDKTAAGVEGASAQATPLTSDACQRAMKKIMDNLVCLLYTSPSPRDATLSRMPSSA